jgi:hypothetical protein
MQEAICFSQLKGKEIEFAHLHTYQKNYEEVNYLRYLYTVLSIHKQG